MINVYIDEFTPCLKDNKTGELVQTEVLRVGRKSFLQKYNEKNGWYINWDELLDDNEVYALVVEGSVDIQGLVALHKDDHAKAVYVTWMCSSPENNPKINEVVKYKERRFRILLCRKKRSSILNKAFTAQPQNILFHLILNVCLLKTMSAQFMSVSSLAGSKL